MLNRLTLAAFMVTALFVKRRSIACVRLSGVESADWPSLQARQLSEQGLLR